MTTVNFHKPHNHTRKRKNIWKGRVNGPKYIDISMKKFTETISRNITIYRLFYFLPWGSGPCGPGKNIQWIANPTTQPVHPSSRPRMYQGPGTVINALYQVGPEPLPAQRDALSLIIVAGIVPSYGQGTRQSHFRNDPMKYDLKVNQIFTTTTTTYWWSTRK